jgi:hypothetical protein
MAYQLTKACLPRYRLRNPSAGFCAQGRALPADLEDAEALIETFGN